MASTVINDPESIKDYRAKIVQSINRLKEQHQSTEAAIQRVGESWQDQEYQEFCNEFGKDKGQINSLCDMLSNYQKVILANLEEKLRNYLSLSMRLG